MKKNIITVLALVTLAVLSRTVFHINNNIEFITAFALVSAYFIKQKRYAIATVLGSIIISDLLIGNTNIVLFTWSGFLFTALVGFALRRTDIKNRLVASEFAAIISTLVFFFWTNFGVVVLGTMYTKDLTGLIQSYYNGIPFLVNQLVGNIIIVPLVFVAFDYFYNNKNSLPSLFLKKADR